nr:hypothetical protein [Mesorhizobium sp. LSJC277A00]
MARSGAFGWLCMTKYIRCTETGKGAVRDSKKRPQAFSRIVVPVLVHFASIYVTACVTGAHAGNIGLLQTKPIWRLCKKFRFWGASMAAIELSSGLPGAHPLSHGARLALRRVVIVAWLAIAIGFAMEALILTAGFAAGSHPAPTQVLIDLAQGVTWSFFVCAGVSLGTAITKVRASLGGLIAMISGPLAMGIAKGTQKVMVSALDVSAKPVILSLTTLGMLRAIEYGLLGWMLASLASKEEPRSLHFMLAGALAGAVFGGGITALTIETAAAKDIALALPQAVATGLIEIVFPIGCSLVVYIALQVSRHMKFISSDAR